MMMENNSLKQINKIKSTISKNDQIVWTCQASTKCYTNEISKLEDEEERVTKGIHTINEQIEESKPLLGILEKCCEVQNRTLEISLESLITERLYKKCLEENVRKHQRECDLLIGEFSEHLEQCKTKLEQTNPLFEILQEKKIELKKSKIRCLDLQQRLKSIKKNNEQRLQIRMQLFYTGIISLAETWLNQKKCSEALEELQEVKQQERELMMKLMQRTEELRLREKLGNAPRDAIITIPQIQFSKKSTDDDVSLNKEKVSPPGNYEKPSMNPFKDIEALFGENKFGPSVSIEKSSAIDDFLNKNDHLPKDKAIICPKVKILEHKTLKMSYVPQQVEELRKEEISKAIDVKLQRVTQNFKRSMSRQNSRKVLIDDKIRNADMSVNTQKSPQEANEANKEPTDETGKHQTGATQDLENLNILSQETRMAINVLSQDSVTSNSAESKLKKFKYLPSDDTNKKLEVDDELSYAEKEIHPQKMDVDNVNLDTDSGETQQNNESVQNNLFKMNDGNAFGRNGQFSMNFAGNSFGNPFKNGVKDVSSKSNIFPLPGTKEMFKPLGNTLNFSQPFKMNNKGNNNTDVVFKVPEAAPVNNCLNQSQNTMIASGTSSAPTQLKNSQNLTLHHEGNNFFDMHGTQYDFRNTMTQMSDIPNDSYELAWSPPAPDLSDDSPMDTNPLFPFGQSNTNFGFSFLK